MEITLKQEQLPEALRRVKEWNLGATSFFIEGMLLSLPDNPIGFEISVDEWPDFSIIMATAGEDYPCNFFSDVVHFTAKDGANVRDCILNSELKDRKALIIDNCPMRYENVYNDLTDHMNAEMLYFSTMHIVSVDLKNLNPSTLADGFTCGVLEEKDAEFMNAHWEFSDEDTSLNYVRILIQVRPNVAIRTREGDLVAWEVMYFSGAMGMLFVMEKHRGKGLAKFVTNKLASKMIDLGYRAYCFVEDHNKASLDLHLKCGFSVNEGHDFYFAKFARKYVCS